MKRISEESIGRAAEDYELTLDPHKTQQVIDYIDVLLEWNGKLNLTAIRDPLEILHRHILECMYAVRIAPMESGRLADVGSGAGFPGIPLKILRPELQVILVESNVKKATFLAEVTRRLGLKGILVQVGRYEELGEEMAPLDFVCSRALGEFDSFLSWASLPTLAAKQMMLWLGGRDLEEVRKYPHWAWKEPVLVPKSLRRFIMLAEKTSESMS